MSVQEIIEKIYQDEYYKSTRYISNSLYKDTPVEDIDDIFEEGMITLLCHAKDGTLASDVFEVDVIKQFYGILKITILEYKKAEAQIQRIEEGYDSEGHPMSWGDIVDNHVSDVPLLPPDVHYQRRKQKERLTDPVKWKRDSDKHKERYYKMKQDPVKWQAYLHRMNVRKKARRAAKKAGTFKDKRFIENRGDV